MRIVTYNMHFGGKDRSHWTKVLDEIQPEIMLVQESFAPVEHLPTSSCDQAR